MRSDWFLPICSGGERLKDNEGNKAHPTQKPESLLHRVILSSSNPGDVVLDPFFGTGTTGAVAKMLGRKFIGIEREQSYADVALSRINAIEELKDTSLVETPSKRSQPRIPFGMIVERGLLKPGTTLFDYKRRYRAQVRADGNLVLRNDQGVQLGSIHKVGATVQGAPSCNGWTFWHFEEKGQYWPIDQLRQQVRAEMYPDRPVLN